jgi:predicted TIM-barrel fold metal-dependent hydrolase
MLKLTIKNVFKVLASIAILAVVIYISIDLIQKKDNIMSFEDYNPPSSLIVESNKTYKAKYPFIDVHNHQWSVPGKDLSGLVEEMDSLNMAYMINLSGSGWGPQAVKDIYFTNTMKTINDSYPDRFGVFVNIDFESIDGLDYAKTQVDIIKDAVNQGAIGLKVYKSLGLNNTDKFGNRIAVNDSRLDPIWAICGELNIPVLIHSAEPALFWEPKDKNNERWLELKQKPGRYRGDSDFFPSFEELLEEQHDIFRKHPQTIFINAHMGWMANDLDRMSSHLDKYPNVMTEIGAVLAELGRQPRRARKFMVDYQDRVMFGKDSYKKEEYYVYFRVLETKDEYFGYYRKRHAFWKMYGMNLPDSVLKKVYYKNALKLFPKIPKSSFGEN